MKTIDFPSKKFVLPKLDFSDFTVDEARTLREILPSLHRHIVDEHEHMPQVLPKGTTILTHVLQFDHVLADKFHTAVDHAVAHQIIAITKNSDLFDSYGLSSPVIDLVEASPLYGLLALMGNRRNLSRIANDYEKDSTNSIAAIRWHGRVTCSHTVKRIMALIGSTIGVDLLGAKDPMTVNATKLADIMQDFTGRLYYAWFTMMDEQLAEVMGEVKELETA